MSGRVAFTEAGERYIGLSFLEGRSISDLATESCCSTRAIEAVLRAQMRHLIEVKRPILERNEHFCGCDECVNKRKELVSLKSNSAQDLTVEAKKPHIVAAI